MLQQLSFRKRVSKGSVFNQVYIPKEMEDSIDVGDEVEVRLISKKINLVYSDKRIKLSEFKIKLIKDVFSFLSAYKIVKEAYFAGSFLTELVDYNDIDILLVVDSDKRKDMIKAENEIYSNLIEKFNLRFHSILIPKEKFEYLLKTCPMTNSMFSLYVSNGRLIKTPKRVLDRDHIEYLLMMPEDIIKTMVPSKVFLDNVLRVISIKRFLEGASLNKKEMDEEIKKMLGDSLFNLMKNNGYMSDKDIKKIRGFLQKNMDGIKGLMRRWERKTA